MTWTSIFYSFPKAQRFTKRAQKMFVYFAEPPKKTSTKLMGSAFPSCLHSRFVVGSLPEAKPLPTQVQLKTLPLTTPTS